MRDLGLTGIRKSSLVVLVVIIWTSTALGGQIGAGVKLHTVPELDTAAAFVTVNGTFDYFAIDGGISWDSLESLGDSTAPLWYYGQAKLRVPVLDIFVPYAAVGAEAITIPSIGSTQAFLLAVGGVELCLSERGIPFSVFAELNWTSPVDNIQFGEAVVFFGVRVDLLTFSKATPGVAAEQEPEVVDDASAAAGEPAEPDSEPCPACEDDTVLRRWRQGG